MYSAPAGMDENAKSSDPAAGVAILLSERMVDKIIDQGHVDTRITWVKLLAGATCCNIFFIVAYIPHKGRTQKPRVKDTIDQLEKLLKTIKKLIV